MTIEIDGLDKLDNVTTDIVEDIKNIDFSSILEAYSQQLQAESPTFFDQKGGLGNIFEFADDNLAQQIADRIFQNREVALDTLVREELGLDPEALGAPWGAAIGSFLAFAAGAIVPVLAYFTGAGWAQFGISAAMSGVALFSVGVGVSLFTGRSALYSGARQLAIGAFAAALTYGIGTAIGAGAGI